jgi:hypothetical protein
MLLSKMPQKLFDTFADYSNSLLTDDSTFGPWKVNYTGFGEVSAVPSGLG